MQKKRRRKCHAWAPLRSYVICLYSWACSHGCKHREYTKIKTSMWLVQRFACENDKSSGIITFSASMNEKKISLTLWMSTMSLALVWYTVDVSTVFYSFLCISVLACQKVFSDHRKAVSWRNTGSIDQGPAVLLKIFQEKMYAAPVHKISPPFIGKNPYSISLKKVCCTVYE